jgi:hypothetical protein
MAMADGYLPSLTFLTSTHEERFTPAITWTACAVPATLTYDARTKSVQRLSPGMLWRRSPWNNQ